jgi:hypothetical protein
VLRRVESEEWGEAEKAGGLYTNGARGDAAVLRDNSKLIMGNAYTIHTTHNCHDRTS